MCFRKYAPGKGMSIIARSKSKDIALGPNEERRGITDERKRRRRKRWKLSKKRKRRCMIFFRGRRKERREKLAVLSLLRPCFPRSDRAYYNRKVESKTFNFTVPVRRTVLVKKQCEKYWEIFKKCAPPRPRPSTAPGTASSSWPPSQSSSSSTCCSRSTSLSTSG